MLPNISLGPLVIPSNGLVFIIGVWIALTVVERSARKLELNSETTYSLAAVSLAAGFIGARLVFVLLHWNAYKVNLSGIIWPLTSGYDLWGGLVIAIAAGFFYGRAKQVPTASTLDALAPGIVTALLVVSLSDFLAGPGYGIETSLLWAIDIYGIDRHPVQIYEMIAAAVALVVWRISLPYRTFDGQLFLITLAVYGGGRLIVDAFRANTWLTNSGIHVIQVLSLAIVLASLFLLARNSTAAVDESQFIADKVDL
ncbi:MAG TPA: prolipoprotein diacylglyceryl transferase family protein [candidate division Zixibacteria bacterium]|nr:prolipoprotein diacylglyceryl transferase family protein [candidate division Zixibacteria bacterium]